MKNCSCGFEMWPLGPHAAMCRRCDTSAQNNGMRVGPPNAPTTNHGWFVAKFGDRK